MNDVTAIYYTSNQMPERFAQQVRNALMRSLDGIPLISVSQKQINLGVNICVGDIGQSVQNIYRQVLIGIKEAKTEYVAMCEDDTLYTKGYFTCFRPKEFGYNMNKWSIFTWVNPPCFNFKENRFVLNECIAKRDIMIDAIEERFAKIPPEKYDNKIHEPGRHEETYGLTVRMKEEFFSPEPNVVFSHADALGIKYGRLGTRKKMGDKRVTYLEPWGNIRDVIEKYMGLELWKSQIR